MDEILLTALGALSTALVTVTGLCVAMVRRERRNNRIHSINPDNNPSALGDRFAVVAEANRALLEGMSAKVDRLSTAIYGIREILIRMESKADR